jgi:hypothetical protein
MARSRFVRPGHLRFITLLLRSSLLRVGDPRSVPFLTANQRLLYWNRLRAPG